MAIKTHTINRWDLGIKDDIDRDLTNGYYKYLENLELKVRGAEHINNVTYISSVGGQDATDMNINKLITVGSWVIGLGWDNDTNKDTCIWTYEASNVLNSHTPATAYAASGKANPFFVYNNGVVYYDNLNKIGKYTTGGAMDGDWASATGGLNGGLVWQDFLWGWLGQSITKLASDGTPTVFTSIVPSGQTVVEILDLGKLLGIVCSGGTTAESKMYLWDGVATSSTDFYDIVKIGTGYVRGAGLLDGVPHVVINSLNYQDIEIKRYSGNTFSTVYNYKGRVNIASPTTYTYTPVMRVKEHLGYLYILVYGSRPESTDVSDYYILRYGRKINNDQYAFSVYKTLYTPASGAQWPATYGDFTIQTDNNYKDISIFNSLQDSNDVMKIYKSSTLLTGQAGAIETSIFTGGYSHIVKKWIGFSISSEPLPSGGSIVGKYKANAESSWTTFFTSDTDNDISKEVINIEATGVNLPNFKELKLRFELLGGAEITGYSIKYEEQINAI